jgi:hypothetical protein
MEFALRAEFILQLPCLKGIMEDRVTSGCILGIQSHTAPDPQNLHYISDNGEAMFGSLENFSSGSRMG